MRDADIDAQRDRHIDSFYRELVAIYRRSRGYVDNFDKLPPPVQIALFDMIFNLGAYRIVHVFRRFDAAIRAGDWVTAAAGHVYDLVSDRPRGAAPSREVWRGLPPIRRLSAPVDLRSDKALSSSAILIVTLKSLAPHACGGGRRYR